MELPLRCTCGHENMVCMERMMKRPVTNLIFVEGYFCGHCHNWKSVFYMTASLEEALRKLETMRPDHPSFRYHFYKTMKRASEIQKRGEQHGKV